MEVIPGITMGRRRLSALAISRRSGMRITLAVTNNGDGTATWTTSASSGTNSDVIAADPDPGNLIASGPGSAAHTWSESTNPVTINDPTTPLYWRYYYNNGGTYIPSNIYGPLTVTGDTDGAAKIAQISGAGYSFTAGQSSGLMTAFSELRRNNQLTNVKSAIAMFFGNSTYNMIPLIGSTPTQSSITTNTKSIIGTGSTSRVDTATQPASAFGSTSKGLIQYYLPVQPSANTLLQGCTGGTQPSTLHFGFRYTGVGTFIDWGTYRCRSAADTAVKGLYSFLKTGATTNNVITRYDSGGQTSLSVTNADVGGASYTRPSQNLYYICRNGNGTPDSGGAITCALGVMVDTASTVDRDILEVIWYNLLDSFGAL